MSKPTEVLSTSRELSDLITQRYYKCDRNEAQKLLRLAVIAIDALVEHIDPQPEGEEVTA